MTPLEIDLCLHYHTRCDDSPWLDLNAPIKKAVMSDLINAGLLVENIDSSKRRYDPTEKLQAFVHMLCATPLPEHRWVDPRTKDKPCA